MLRFVAASASLCAVSLADGQVPTVVVTGATGRTGSLLYKRLKSEEGKWNVRAFVRNSTKAKGILGCDKCDESEGVFEGDLTKPSTLTHVMQGADVLAIATASEAKCDGIPPFGKCTYPAGAAPKDIDFLGTKAQVQAFGTAGGDNKKKHILYVSTMDTTQPDNFLDKLANGYVSFYHLQAEVEIMSSGIPFTIPKACGLGDGEGGKKALIVGHDDSSFSLILNHEIKRDDVARFMVEAIRDPALSAGLRFDLCSKALGAATTDIANDVFKAAKFPWQKSSGAVYV